MHASSVSIMLTFDTRLVTKQRAQARDQLSAPCAPGKFTVYDVAIEWMNACRTILPVDRRTVPAGLIQYTLWVPVKLSAAREGERRCTDGLPSVHSI